MACTPESLIWCKMFNQFATIARPGVWLDVVADVALVISADATDDKLIIRLLFPRNIKYGAIDTFVITPDNTADFEFEHWKLADMAEVERILVTLERKGF